MDHIEASIYAGAARSLGGENPYGVRAADQWAILNDARLIEALRQNGDLNGGTQSNPELSQRHMGVVESAGDLSLRSY